MSIRPRGARAAVTCGSDRRTQTEHDPDSRPCWFRPVERTRYRGSSLGGVFDFVDRHGLSSVTGKTLSTREALKRELRATRERGYSVNDQGIIEGLRAIGAPVTGPDGGVIGGLSISGPIHRMEGERLEEHIPSLLLGATNELELNIAYQ